MTMHALLALLLLAAPSNATIGNDLSAGGTASASKVTSAGTVEGLRLTYPAPTTDAAPSPMTLKSPNVLHNATTNKTGASLFLSGGIGETDIRIIDKSTVGTLTFARTVDGVTPANVVWTAGTTWVCAAAASEAECATNLNTYCNANKPSGVCGCSNTTAGHVYVQWCDGTTVGASVATSDAAKMSVTQGTNGEVISSGRACWVFDRASMQIGVSGAHLATRSSLDDITALNSTCNGYANMNVASLAAQSNITSGGTITSSATGALGWHVVAVANQACDTTCTTASVVGWDTASTHYVPVNHDDATADVCLCAGAN
jgi:hypothetical protein